MSEPRRRRGHRGSFDVKARFTRGRPVRRAARRHAGTDLVPHRRVRRLSSRKRRVRTRVARGARHLRRALTRKADARAWPSDSHHTVSGNPGAVQNHLDEKISQTISRIAVPAATVAQEENGSLLPFRVRAGQARDRKAQVRTKPFRLSLVVHLPSSSSSLKYTATQASRIGSSWSRSEASAVRPRARRGLRPCHRRAHPGREETAGLYRVWSSAESRGENPMASRVCERSR